MTYNLASFIVFVLLSGIWSTKNWSNLLLKLTFIGMSIWSGVLSLEQFGYIVKV